MNSSSSLDLVLIEVEGVLSILEVVNNGLLSFVVRIRVGLGMREELLKHEEELISLELFL